MIEGRRYPSGFVVAIYTRCWESHRLVWRIIGGVIVALMTTNTGGWRVAREVAMTGCATGRCMRTVQWPHAAVIKCGRNPGGLIVTHRTVCRESGRFVIGIGGSVIICQVATHTGVWCIVVVSVVTCCTIIGNIGMCTQ